MKKALMIVTNGFEEVEAIGTLGIFKRSRLPLDLASFHDHEATGAFGTKVSNLLNIHEVNLDDYEMLIIPGGPEYMEFSESQLFKDIVLDFYHKDKFIGAICAGPTLLGKLGLLKGKNYVCFKRMNEDFGGNFIDEYVVRDDKIITALSAAASIEFGLTLVEALGGKELVEQEKASFYYKKQ